MPLLERKPFRRIKPPQDLSPNEELFYCKATHEVFRQYEQFFERVILCNSLVWTCSMTGKSNITFQEALESEENARISLKTFPLALKKPVFYLASLSTKPKLNDLCDDIFNFVKDRYFIGEEVEAFINGTKKSCEITQVIIPDKISNKSPNKTDSSKKKPKELNPSRIKYEVVDYGSGRTTVVKAENINRPKGTYTKPRNKLLLKHYTEPKNGTFQIKEAVAAKLQLKEFQFNEVFPGPLPAYAAEKKNTPEKNGTNRKKIVQGKLNFKKETMEERRKNLEKIALTEKQKLAAEKKVKDAKMKKLMDESKIKEEKLKEKEKKKEERRKVAEYLNNWKKPREDLECDDLKELPIATPVDCGIPQNCFGDALLILEFLNTFSKQVYTKDTFPHGFTLEYIEKALTEKNIQGVLNDLLQLLLTAIFRYQEAEQDNLDLRNKTIESLDNLTIEQAMEVATIAAAWPQKYHGTMLRNIPMDSFSITEVVRLHILSSGSRPRISWQGVVSPSEDPGLYFKMEESELIKKLGKCSVFELDCEERCKILTLLVHQLLACDVLKYTVDEYAESTKPVRNQLKELRQNYYKKRREDSNKKKGPKDKVEVNGEGTAEAPLEIDDEEKENTKDLTPEEKEALEEKKIKDAARETADFLRKEQELLAQLSKLKSSFNVSPIGCDRAFRRYWVFQTVGGIFVEDDDPYKGVCLPKPVPQLQNMASIAMNPESADSIKKYLQQIESKNGICDKENEILRDLAIVQSELPFPSKNRKLSDLNSRVDAKKPVVENGVQEIEGCVQCKLVKTDVDDLVKFCPHSKFSSPADQCSANLETCPIHNVNAPRTQWSFYYTEEEVDALIKSLNPRGFREKILIDALNNRRGQLKDIMMKCPFNVLNKTLPIPIEPIRKSQRHNNYNNSIYANTLPQDALEATLREMILEMENRIYTGGLGSLKVENPEAWRTAIEQEANRIICENGFKEEKSLKDDIESDIKMMSLPIPLEKVVKDLATAIVELSAGIEAKYLTPPLGETDEQKKAKQKKDADADKKKDTLPMKTNSTPLQRWQESVMECTTLSQLFVHLGTLERSVAWSKSILKAHCRICRRRGDAENMLLCDGCNRGHHLYCLKPPLQEIPEGDWFCVSCKPVEIPVSPTKKSHGDESESEAESNEEEESESDDVDVEEVEEESGEEDSEENDDAVQESCEVCGDVGTLLCCDGCPLMYHAECVELRRIPRGEWFCPKCLKKEEALKKARKHPSNGTYGTRASSVSTDDKKKSKPSLKAKLASKGVKRKYEDSFEEEFEPPTKKSNRDRKSSNSLRVEKEDNSSKKDNKDSAQNTVRRRFNTGKDSDMLDYKACIDMIVDLMRHPSSWPFLVPVARKDAPGYHQKIKKPMDFGTIRSNLNCMKYKNNQEFVYDIYLVLHNCWLFNPKSSEEFKAAEVLESEVKRLLTHYQISHKLPRYNHFEAVNGS